MAEHSMCQPGRPLPHGLSHARLAGLGAFPQREVAGVPLLVARPRSRVPASSCSGSRLHSLP